jgi:hypothetical protein
LQVNYDQGIKYGRDYTVKSYFTSPNGTQGNYFSIIVHGDAIGSHIESIDVFIDGTTHNLLPDPFGSTFSLSFLLFNKL